MREREIQIKGKRKIKKRENKARDKRVASGKEGRHKLKHQNTQEKDTRSLCKSPPLRNKSSLEEL